MHITYESWPRSKTRGLTLSPSPPLFLQVTTGYNIITKKFVVTCSKFVVYAGVKIVPIAVLDDNYSYLVIDTVTNVAAVVDPADPAAVKVILILN